MRNLPFSTSLPYEIPFSNIAKWDWVDFFHLPCLSHLALPSLPPSSTHQMRKQRNPLWFSSSFPPLPAIRPARGHNMSFPLSLISSPPLFLSIPSPFYPGQRKRKKKKRGEKTRKGSQKNLLSLHLPLEAVVYYKYISLVESYQKSDNFPGLSRHPCFSFCQISFLLPRKRSKIISFAETGGSGGAGGRKKAQ